jgi:chromosome segregation ATPase
MNRSTIRLLFCTVALSLSMIDSSHAQSNIPARPQQEEVIKELLSEVRQLRIALQRMGLNSYRGQVMVERLRLQQGLVTRLAEELNGIRNQIGDTRAGQTNLKEKVEELENQKEKGLVAESEVNAAKAAMGELKQREQRFVEREAQLSTELSAERANLEDLNKRLDALERELVLTSVGDESKKKGQ